MKKAWIGIAAAAGLALTLGCQDRLEPEEVPPPSIYEEGAQLGEPRAMPEEENAIGGSGAAQQQPAQQQPQQAQQQEEKTIIGRVASAGEDQVIVQDTYRKAHKLEINEQTEIIGTGEGLSAQPRLLQGIDVRVSFTGEGENAIAKRIEVFRAEPAQQQPAEQ